MTPFELLTMKHSFGKFFGLLALNLLASYLPLLTARTRWRWAATSLPAGDGPSNTATARTLALRRRAKKVMARSRKAFGWSLVRYFQTRISAFMSRAHRLPA